MRRRAVPTALGGAMKIAVCATSDGCASPVDERFGRAGYILVYDSGTDAWNAIRNDINLHSAQGAGLQTAATVANAGCEALVCMHCGPKALAVLDRARVQVYRTAGGNARDAVAALVRNQLPRLMSADVQGHW